jgi:hypothetical protein
LTVKLTREQRSRENLSVPNLLAQQLALCFYVAIRLSKIKTLFRRSVETSTLDWSAFDVHPEHQGCRASSGSGFDEPAFQFQI